MDLFYYVFVNILKKSFAEIDFHWRNRNLSGFIKIMNLEQHESL